MDREAVKSVLRGQEIELPSWAFGNSGTRFNVFAQPGAQSGKLTQCPVSGVVFAVDANRPHVRIGKDEYVTCCDKCATKLKHDPRHYLRV